MKNKLMQKLRRNLDNLRNKYNRLSDENDKNVLDLKDHLDMVLRLNFWRGKIRGYEEIFSKIAEEKDL